MTFDTFTPDLAASLDGPDWLRSRRTAAFEELATMPLPSEKEEVWRYTPIDELRLEEFVPAGPAPSGAPGPDDSLAAAFVRGLDADVPVRSALVVVRDGRTVSVTAPGPAASRVAAGRPSIGGLELLGPEAGIGSVVAGGDLLVRLNDAFHPGAVVVDVPAGVVVEAPVVIVHWCSSASTGSAVPDGAAGRGPADGAGGGAVSGLKGRATFPRTFVRLGPGASAGVVEVVAGAAGTERGLVVPVTELAAAEGAQLSYVALQVLGPQAWHIARVGAVAARDASLRTFTAGLGAGYDRSRTDSLADGPGASTELRSAYLGTGRQVHDVRTLQDHAAPHTTSDLLCKGAVAGSSRSVYSGLIRVRRGAVRTDAFQTNQNLVLDPHAHADSVPNLDIQENDVRCSHASTVGPVDEDQLYYLESRGVPPERAERLIVLGFFEDIIRRSPVDAIGGRLRQEVALRLGDALADEALVEKALAENGQDGDPHREGSLRENLADG